MVGKNLPPLSRWFCGALSYLPSVGCGRVDAQRSIDVKIQCLSPPSALMVLLPFALAFVLAAAFPFGSCHALNFSSKIFLKFDTSPKLSARHHGKGIKREHQLYQDHPEWEDGRDPSDGQRGTWSFYTLFTEWSTVFSVKRAPQIYTRSIQCPSRRHSVFLYDILC